MPDTKLVEWLQTREHYFRNASEGEYDANLLQSARLEITRLTTDLTAMTAERDRMREALEVIGGGALDVSNTAIIVGHGADVVMRQVKDALSGGHRG